MRAGAALVLALALLAGGCGNDNSARDARASVSRFFAAFESRDGAGACQS
jgi:hypothetical protein